MQQINNHDRVIKGDKSPRIGVAFSGGGVRGLAHLGVLQAMEENGIPIHFAAGTSMGGLVAGLYATGMPLSDLVDFARKTGFMDIASIDQFRQGLLGHEKMAKLLADLLGTADLTFEELKIPATVLAADVETGELVVLDHGPLIPALMATSAFPLVFGPVYHQERWLVDGGVLNNLPVDIIRQMGANRVLGVNVPSSLKLPLEGEEHKSGLFSHLLFSAAIHLSDWKAPFLIAEVSTSLASQVINRTRLLLSPPDLMLEVRLLNAGLFTADRDEVIKAGYDIAMRHLAKLTALQTKPIPHRLRRSMIRLTRRLNRAWEAFQQPEYTQYPPKSNPK